MFVSVCPHGEKSIKSHVSWQWARGFMCVCVCGQGECSRWGVVYVCSRGEVCVHKFQKTSRGIVLCACVCARVYVCSGVCLCVCVFRRSRCLRVGNICVCVYVCDCVCVLSVHVSV